MRLAMKHREKCQRIPQNVDNNGTSKEHVMKQRIFFQRAPAEEAHVIRKVVVLR